jgi:hypothetical protein
VTCTVVSGWACWVVEQVGIVSNSDFVVSKSLWAAVSSVVGCKTGNVFDGTEISIPPWVGFLVGVGQWILIVVCPWALFASINGVWGFTNVSVWVGALSSTDSGEFEWVWFEGFDFTEGQDLSLAWNPDTNVSSREFTGDWLWSCVCAWAWWVLPHVSIVSNSDLVTS